MNSFKVGDNVEVTSDQIGYQYTIGWQGVIVKNPVNDHRYLVEFNQKIPPPYNTLCIAHATLDENHRFYTENELKKLGIPKMALPAFKIRGTMANIKYPCLVDVKYDGIPVLITIEAGLGGPASVIGETELGTKYDLRHIKFRIGIDVKKYEKQTHNSAQLLAELIVNEGKNNDLHELLKDPKSKNTKIRIFDLVELGEEIITIKPLLERRDILVDILHQDILVDSIIVDSKEELDEYVEAVLDEGYEGVVVKNLSEPFNLQTWVKIKKEEEYICRVVKIEDTRIEVEFNSKIIGLNRTFDAHVGAHIIVKCNGITKNGSLRNPVAKNYTRC